MRQPFYDVLHRPWGPEWQTWHRSQRDRQWARAKGNLHKSRDAILLALPARFVVCIPMWVESADPTIVSEMARLKIEMMGLVSSERVAVDASVDLLNIADGHTLVRACVFPSDLPASAAHLKADAYVPSPLALTLEPNAIHIWNELGDTVVAVCRDSEVVCWETDHATSPDELSVWIRCLLAELDAKRLLPSAATILDWSGRITECRNFPTLCVPASARIEGPPIAKREPSTGWKSPSLRRQEDSRRRRTILAVGACLIGGLLIAGVAGAMGYSWFLGFSLQRLRAEYAEKREATRPLRQCAAQWTRVERAVLPDLFPLEILHSVAKCLPTGGVKLTVFEVADARQSDSQREKPDGDIVQASFSVRLHGQAQNASLATKFLNTLTANMKNVDWRMATPSFQPDNTASFIIECKRHATQSY